MPLGVRRALPLAAPCLAMLVLGLWGIDRGSVYSAEAATMWTGSLTVPQLMHLLSQSDAVHASFYLAIHPVFLLLGHTEVVMRLPSVAAAVGSVAATYALARRLDQSRATAAVAAWLVVVSPTQSSYAQDGRPYTLLVLLALLACLVLLSGMRTTAWWPWLAYTVLVVVAGSINEVSGALLVVAHGVTLLVSRPRWAVWWRWLLSSAVAAVLLTPLLLLSVHQDKQVNWIAPPTLRTLGTTVTVLTGAPWLPLLVVLGLALVGALVGQAGRWPTPAALLAPLAVVPTGLLAAESWVARPLFDSRYVVFSMPAIMLLAALGLTRATAALRLGRGGSRVALGLAGAVVLAVAVAQTPTQLWLRTPQSRTWDLHQAADRLHRHAAPGDAVVFLPASLDYTALAYPWAVHGLDQAQLAVGPRAAGRFHGVPRTRRQLISSLAHAHRVWVVTDRRVLRPGNRRTERLLRQHYRTRASYPFHGGDVVELVRRH